MKLKLFLCRLCSGTPGDPSPSAYYPPPHPTPRGVPAIYGPISHVRIVLAYRYLFIITVNIYDRRRAAHHAATFGSNSNRMSAPKVPGNNLLLRRSKVKPAICSILTPHWASLGQTWRRGNGMYLS